MDFLEVARNFGLPLTLLIFAVIALWRAWRVERQLREKELTERAKKLAVREEELYALYRAIALKNLSKLVRKRLLKYRKQDGQNREVPG